MITTQMENDPAHAKRLEDNLIRRADFANPETELAAQSEGRTAHVKTRLGRHKNLSSPEELRATRLEMTWRCDRLALANDRWSQAATTKWCAHGTCVTRSTNDIPQTHTWKIEGEVTLLRDVLAKARTEERSDNTEKNF